MSDLDDTFYVYEHWRSDLDVCFYVGKGKKHRAYEITPDLRNPYYNKVVEHLERLGLDVIIHFHARNLIESEAFCIEGERIAYYRKIGIELTNIATGGRWNNKNFKWPISEAQFPKVIEKAHRYRGVGSTRKSRQRIYERALQRLREDQ
jgi:hypothetical protein